MSVCTKWMLSLASILYLGQALLVPAAPDQCMEDIYTRFFNPGMNCVSNDVRFAVAEATIVDLDPECWLNVSEGSCCVGLDVTVELTFNVILNAQARYDLGLYVAANSGADADARRGECYVFTPDATENRLRNGVEIVADLDRTGNRGWYCTNGSNDEMAEEQNGFPLRCPANDDPFCSEVFGDGSTCQEFGNMQDMCADIDTNISPFQAPVGKPLTFECRDRDGDGSADVPGCSAWHMPGQNQLCLSPTAIVPPTNGAADCRCESIRLGIPISSVPDPNVPGPGGPGPSGPPEEQTGIPVGAIVPMVVAPVLFLLWFLWPLLFGTAAAVAVKKKAAAATAVAAPAPAPVPVAAPAPKKKWAVVDASNYIWATGGGGAAPMKTEWGALGAVKSAPGCIEAEVPSSLKIRKDEGAGEALLGGDDYSQNSGGICSEGIGGFCRAICFMCVVCWNTCMVCCWGCYTKCAGMRPERASVKSNNQSESYASLQA